jgi:molybdate transport repressor ModE-like protein
VDVQQLRFLRAIAAAGSLTRAAKELGISQPTLSVSIQQLEAELGAVLLMRHARGVSLTAAGEELLVHGNDVLIRFDRIPQLVQEVVHGLRGTFVVGCYESLGAWFLPGFLQRVLSGWSGIDVRLHNAPSALVREAVIDGTVHYGVVVNAVPHPDLVMVPVCHDVIEVVASPRVVREHGAACVEHLPCFMIARPPFDEVLQQLAALEIRPSRVVLCGDLELVKTLTLAEVGVGILPRRVASYGHPGALVPIDPTWPRFDDTISVLRRADLPRTRAGAVVWEALLGHGRSLDTFPAAVAGG